MIFEQKGNTENPKMMFIHAMYCNSNEFDELAKMLADKYCLIIPTLDGHAGDGSVFKSAEDETGLLPDYR